ncbi:MAG: ABC transporter substrate-binding protein [Desulfarculaceae bacterium]|nr:ABC transporter substrate-binding protein [Desulfarculaceae bacterium]MCF8071586.1 ABC transporter substrate-binding protein [Desulfarculaceae bacterium]MCF8102401.1 ABC transporter substrate-binding protein [Desulfarculaceae bacterium]MCF8114865.1 ABC transporter substrate-binding protein [Desulfarculaceae bacterium]
MRKLTCILAITMLISGLLLAPAALAADKIVIGVTTSLNFLEGKEAHNAVNLAVGEINKAGGVKVGGKMLPFVVESIDIRDAAPGVPVPEALLGMEKLILEKKPNALVVGPFRSEALLAGMDMLAKHKVPLLGTIAMSPKTEARVAKNPKYKYVFRVSLDAKYFVGYIAGVMGFMGKEFGFNKVFIMNQDVAWARATAGIMTKIFKGKLKWDVVGHETFPTGASDFAPALMKAKMKGAQVIMPVFDMPQSGILIKQWKAMKVPAVMAGFISPLTGPTAWKTFDAKIGGVVNAVFELGSIPSAKYPPSKKFYDAYVAKYGKPLEAGHGPAPAYASVYLLKAAIEKAGSLDPDAIVAALRATDAPSVMGHVKFTKGNQVIYGKDPKKAALGCFFQWSDDGKRVIVYPPAIAEGKIKLPTGMKAAK